MGSRYRGVLLRDTRLCVRSKGGELVRADVRDGHIRGPVRAGGGLGPAGSDGPFLLHYLLATELLHRSPLWNDRETLPRVLTSRPDASPVLSYSSPVSSITTIRSSEKFSWRGSFVPVPVTSMYHLVIAVRIQLL